MITLDVRTTIFQKLWNWRNKRYIYYIVWEGANIRGSSLYVLNEPLNSSEMIKQVQQDIQDQPGMPDCMAGPQKQLKGDWIKGSSIMLVFWTELKK